MVSEPATTVAGASALSVALEEESARTDAAFEAWMAIAGSNLDRAPTAPLPARRRSVVRFPGERRWVRPGEVIGSLLVVAVALVLLLSFVG